MECLLSSILYSDLIQNPEKNVDSLVLTSYISLRTSSQVERGGKENQRAKRAGRGLGEKKGT